MKLNNVDSLANKKLQNLFCQDLQATYWSFHSEQALKYGTKISWRCYTSKRRSKTFEGLPVFNTVQEAKEKTNAQATMIYVPLLQLMQAIETTNAELELIVCITEACQF